MSTFKKFYGRQGYHRAKLVSTFIKLYGRQGYHRASLCQHFKSSMGDRVITE